MDIIILFSSDVGNFISPVWSYPPYRFINLSEHFHNFLFFHPSNYRRILWTAPESKERNSKEGEKRRHDV